MSRSTFILIVSFAFLGSLCLASSIGLRNDRHKCTLPPGAQVRCITEFTGVCAFFQDPSTGGCSSNLSQMYSANSCIACSNPDVKYYEDGPCKADKVFCDPKVRPEVCTREYNPVCAYSTDSKGKHTIVNTAGNACSACSNPAVDYFIQGECPAPPKPVVKRAYCDAKNRPEMCTMIYDPVCATLSKCPKGQKSCTQTFSSGCSACSNTNVLSYVSGECKN